MPEAATIGVWALLAAGFVLVAVLVRGHFLRLRAREKLLRAEERSSASQAALAAGPAAGTAPGGQAEPSPVQESWLKRWLSVSGFRSSGAPALFLLAQAGAFAVGGLLTLLILRSGYHELGVEWLYEIPGGVGAFLAPILAAAPWMLFLIVALLPVSRVRGRRQAIVKQVERDLPMMLVLLSTLVESGLGFDAAVQRVLQSTDEERYLAEGLRTFRSENRAGVPRVTCFRRLAQRLDVGSVSTFVSAMVHAEHVGGSIAESLRRQADEVWSRRRELAIQRAQTLPTRLAVPLVTCFLPGIFVYTFGPALAEFIRIAENVVQ